MYFALLHKITPKNWGINVLKNSFLGRSQVLKYFSTTRNDRIFVFPRALSDTYIDKNLCNLVDYTRKHSKITVSMSLKKVFFYRSQRPKMAISMYSKKDFLVGFRFSNLFRLLETPEFIFTLGFFQTYIGMNSCILVYYT